MPRTLVLAVLALATLACGGGSSVCEEACAHMSSCGSAQPQCVSMCESQLSHPEPAARQAAAARYQCAATADCAQVDACLMHTEDQ